MKANDNNRGTGRTTRQMQNALQGAVFITSDPVYTKWLAEKYGRCDLKIVSPAWLEYGWQGREFSGIVVDHAAKLTTRQAEMLDQAMPLVRVAK